ncbi:MAG: ATP-binding protein [Lachnospiraceae bacterium]|nr:ATP-binding protein [Lachnospiraceae bacterium]
MIITTALSYSLMVGILIAIKWSEITISLRLSALLYVLLSTVSYFILIFIDRELMISGATIVLCLIIMQLNLQNPQMISEAIEHEQEEKLEAIRANREKSNFLANMSHEIRTPLNVITSMNEMILRESKNEQIEDYAQRIKTSGEILVSIINNVFDISKIEVGQAEIMEDEYELADLLKELTAIGSVRAEDKHLLFLTEVDPKLPQMLYGDSQHLRQIVMNLVVNATKYTNRGSITFKATFESIDENRINLILTVSDTGIGISEDQVTHVFDAFSRAGIEKMTNIEGTGLGLAIAKRFTEMMNGSIEVKSKKGVGSTFTVKIPQEIRCEEQIGNFEIRRADYVKERRMNQHTFVAPDAKILIVDDNAMNRMAIQCLLNRTAIQVDLAESGLEALEKVKQNFYHIIFLDYMMPEMNGIDTLHAMKKLESNLSIKAPVIALTANAVGGARQMFLAEGFDGYLAKPVLWEELESMIVSLLPEELVVQKEVKQLESALETEQMEQYSKNLYDADISLTEGLYYVNGDLEQYRKQAGLFVNFYDSSRDELEKIYESGDMKKIGAKIHALKGNAKSIGAVDLYYTARRMEQRCNREDRLYVATIMPHLFMEWERARDGLREFILSTKIEEGKETLEYDASRVNELFDQIGQCIEDSKAIEGIYLVKELLNYSLPEAQTVALEQIITLLEEIEYEDAEKVLQGVVYERQNKDSGH